MGYAGPYVECATLTIVMHESLPHMHGYMSNILYYIPRYLIIQMHELYVLLIAYAVHARILVAYCRILVAWPANPSSESHQRYLLEHGYLLHSAGVKQIEEAISEGRLVSDDWQHVYTVMAKNMGHFCMVLHTMVSGLWSSCIELTFLTAYLQSDFYKFIALIFSPYWV